MDKINKELLAKCKGAHSAAELASIAKANSFDITDESAEAYFRLLNKSTGILSDDELDNVAGGTCYNDGRPVVSAATYCHYLYCTKCGDVYTDCNKQCNGGKSCIHRRCTNCKYCVYEKGLWLCTNPANAK